jgi:hypothetical protein
MKRRTFITLLGGAAAAVSCWVMALAICSLLVLVENDRYVSAGDRVKWNEVMPAPISPDKNSLVCTSLAGRKGWAWR